MPIYEYVCNQCNKTFSLLQKVGSETDTACPKCGSKTVDKKVSSFSCCSDSGFSSLPSGGFSGGG